MLNLLYNKLKEKEEEIEVEEEQMNVIEIINACFNKSTLDRKAFVL